MSDRDRGPRDHEGDDNGVPPDLSPNSRRLAAGQVLFVMLIGLGLAALMNAEEMVHRVETQLAVEDPSRKPKLWIWERVEDVAGLVLLDVPRSELEEAAYPILDREESQLEELTPEQILALQTGESDSEGSDPDAAGATTTTAPDPAPTIRTPTAEEPLRFWVGGDSMSQTFGTEMERIASETGIIAPTLDYRVATGLTRPDYFNWPAHLVDTVLPADPEVVVIMFGANDSQGLERTDGTVCQRFEQCWLDAYRSRVAATMDLLRDREQNDRVVIWVGQPIMGPESGVYGMEKLNFIYWDEARSRPWVEFFDSWPFFADREGRYAHSLPGCRRHRAADAPAGPGALLDPGG